MNGTPCNDAGNVGGDDLAGRVLIDSAGAGPAAGTCLAQQLLVVLRLLGQVVVLQPGVSYHILLLLFTM